MEMTGAQIIVKLLERQGIETVCGIPGGTVLPLYHALSTSSRIRHVLARHEQGAGFVAQGMARVTGRPQVCIATSGPGATNVITALADAKLDSIPLVCITGQVPRSMIGTDAFQEVDTCALSSPITKRNYLVRSAKTLLHIIPEAFRIAASGRPGPVLVDVPKDVQTRMVAFDQWPAPGHPDPLPQVDLPALARAADLIASSSRPVLYIGGGVVRSGGAEAALRLAEKAGIPTTMTLMGLGAIPSAHPLSLGMLGMHAARHTNLALAQCDLLLAVGVRFDDRATGRLDAFCPNAKVVHIDIDPREVNKLRTAQVGIICDAREALIHLLPLVPHNRRNSWQQTIKTLKNTYPQRIHRMDDTVSPTDLIAATAGILGSEAIIVSDVGQHQMWTAQAYPFEPSHHFLTSGGLGTMGFGLPTAIGASLARPDSTVVCFCGDGGLLMNLQEMATAMEQRVNVKIMLMDNQTLGLVHQQQELFYDGNTFASEFSAPVDYVHIARGFGMKSFDLSEVDNPISALNRAFKEKGTCLVRIPVKKENKVYPMVPPGAPNTEMIYALPEPE